MAEQVFCDGGGAAAGRVAEELAILVKRLKHWSMGALNTIGSLEIIGASVHWIIESLNTIGAIIHFHRAFPLSWSWAVISSHFFSRTQGRLSPKKKGFLGNFFQRGSQKGGGWGPKNLVFILDSVPKAILQKKKVFRLVTQESYRINGTRPKWQWERKVKLLGLECWLIKRCPKCQGKPVLWPALICIAVKFVLFSIQPWAHIFQFCNETEIKFSGRGWDFPV